MDMKPLGTRALIQLDPETTKTDSGIELLLGHSKDQPKRGRVVNVGSKLEAIKVGDHVIFQPYAGVEVEDDLFMVNEDDILAVIE